MAIIHVDYTPPTPTHFALTHNSSNQQHSRNRENATSSVQFRFADTFSSPRQLFKFGTTNNGTRAGKSTNVVVVLNCALLCATTFSTGRCQHWVWDLSSYGRQLSMTPSSNFSFPSAHPPPNELSGSKQHFVHPWTPVPCFTSATDDDNRSAASSSSSYSTPSPCSLWLPCRTFDLRAADFINWLQFAANLTMDSSRDTRSALVSPLRAITFDRWHASRWSPGNFGSATFVILLLSFSRSNSLIDCTEVASVMPTRRRLCLCHCAAAAPPLSPFRLPHFPRPLLSSLFPALLMSSDDALRGDCCWPCSEIRRGHSARRTSAEPVEMLTSG